VKDFTSNLFGLYILAYTLGLRHALDADHLAAIDNVTRKLINEGKRPLTVGLFFSLGHSTIVFLLTIIVSVSTTLISESIPEIEELGSIIGSFISASILYIVGIANLYILLDLYKKREVKNIENLQIGLMSRIMKSIFNIISNNLQIYTLGLLFGLGFNTATEIALLGLSAISTIQGLPLIEIVFLPISFAVGMITVDTLDGFFMTSAYSWAFTDPLRKLYYNLTITSISVIIALIIGSTEYLQVISSEFNLRGGFWSIINTLNLSDLGYFIVGIFAVCWGISAIIYKLRFNKNNK
jgi:high-affinity nickel-transport protein